MNYEELLNKAYEKLPKVKEGGERFEIPEIDSVMEGNQTMIRNFVQIAETLRRDPEHMLKFFTKELAAPGSIKGKMAIIQTKVMKKKIQEKLETYVREYVVCKECHRPDTKLVKENRITILICEACGAKYGVR